MKKIILFICFFVCVFVLVACKPEEQKQDYKLTLNETTVQLTVDDTYEINPTVKDYLESLEFTYTIEDNGVLSIEKNKITALKPGTNNVKVSVKSLNLEVTLAVTVNAKPTIYISKIEITGEKKMEVDGTQTLVAVITPENAENKEVTWISNNNSVAKVDEFGKVTAVGIGEATITAMAKDALQTKGEFMITVDKKYVTSITVTGEKEIYLRKTTNLEATVLPADATDKSFKWESSNETVATVDENGVVTGAYYGTSIIKAVALDGSGVFGEIEITVLKDTEAPVISVDESVVKTNVSISYNDDSFDPMKGVSAIDNVDGDISSKITVTGEVNNRRTGVYTLTYTVKDSAKNEAVFTRDITVVWDYAVSFIGHAGCYSGIMNTEEAFIKAATVHGYQAIECDVKQTKDGVFITCHDDTFNGVTLASTNYNDLKDITLTTTRGGISYTSKICTLERYLNICKQYGVKAVVELKYSNGINNNDTSRMQALMDLIIKCEMDKDVIFLGSQYNCLAWTRSNGYSYIPCQYLVNSADSETVYNRCIEFDYDISFNVSYTNTQEWIDRYHEAGKKVSCYTFSQYTTATDCQKWINMGVDFVTVDVIKPYECELPKIDTTVKTKYKVTFKDWDDSVIKEVMTEEGKKATTPVDPSRTGYTFVGWDTDVTKVTSELTVKAIYTLDTYKIVYDSSLKTIIETEWENKEAFVNEFYTDWFAWLDSKVGVIAGLTKTGDTYKFEKNGKAPTWTDVATLRALDIYDVELTIGTIAIKPVNRPDKTTVLEPVVDNGYFLNTEPYRTKYLYMDGYLLNCINTTSNYSAYSTDFKPTGAGKVQIFFRFHQWAKGTNIVAFNTLPKKCAVTELTGIEVVLPTTPVSYTVNDTITLPLPTATGATFTGWYLDSQLTIKIESIVAGTTGDIRVYAKWAK